MKEKESKNPNKMDGKPEVDKFEQAIQDLTSALSYRKRALEEKIIYSGIAKSFEVAIEYAWKFLKRELEAQSLEAYSPKEIVKTAGRAGLIDDVELWIQCLNARNIAVHDYLGITQTEYLDLIERFLPLLKKLK